LRGGDARNYLQIVGIRRGPLKEKFPLVRRDGRVQIRDLRRREIVFGLILTLMPAASFDGFELARAQGAEKRKRKDAMDKRVPTLLEEAFSNHRWMRVKTLISIISRFLFAFLPYIASAHS